MPLSPPKKTAKQQDAMAASIARSLSVDSWLSALKTRNVAEFERIRGFSFEHIAEIAGL